MKRFTDRINKAIERIKATNSLIQIVSHLDSATGDNELLVEIDCKLKRMNFEELFNYCSLKFGTKKRTDGKIYSIPKNVRVFSLDKNGKVVLVGIKGIIKHKTKKKIYRIKTKIGSVKVTENHSLISLKNNKFCAEKPERVKFVSSPRKYIFGNLNPHINLLDFKDVLARFRVTENKKFIEIKHTKNRIKIPIKIDLDKNILCFLGMWVADGSYTGKRSETISISCYDNEECKNIIDKAFGIFGNSKPCVTDDGVTASITSTTLNRLMKLLGFIGYARTKRVPEWIFGLKEHLMIAFLQGYFSGDGTVSKGDINVTSYSKKLIKDIQTLLLFFGIRACVRKDRNGYKLSINANKMKKIFLEKIGFLQKQKTLKVKIGKKSNYQDYIPIEKELIRNLIKENISKVERKRLLEYLKRKKPVTRYRLFKLLNFDIGNKKKKIISKLVNSDVFWEDVKVNLVSSDKEVEVYDIETKNGNFICENLVLKNTDGIASASIMASALLQTDKSFQITFINRINDEIIETLKERNPELVIFTDMGSGYLDLINKLDFNVVVLDHHQIEGSPSENVIHINPEEFDLKLSGSGTTYLLAKEMLKNNSLAPLAIVGTIGDVSYPTNSKLFDTPLIEAEIGLNLFGRFSRPLYKALEFSGIPGIDEESKAIQFLSEIGIKPQENGEWKTLNGLKDEEKRKLTDAIVKESLKHEKFSKKLIFGNVLTLKNFPDELKDGKEFATILNACANMQEPAVGLALCLGNEKYLETARNLLKAYKKVIGNYMRWIENNPEKRKQTEFANYILGKDMINENFIGTIVSMLFREMNKTLIGFGNSKDGIKVSGRSKEVNIKEIIVEAARVCEGRGGGHKSAVGAIIPAETQEKFIETCESLLKEKLIGTK